MKWYYWIGVTLAVYFAVNRSYTSSPPPLPGLYDGQGGGGWGRGPAGGVGSYWRWIDGRWTSIPGPQ